MMKKTFLHTLPLLGILFLASCAKDLVPEEVLQLPKDAKLHTAYNLWYSDPEDLTAENILTGSILPAGTVAEITGMTEKEVNFKAKGRNFRITLKSGQLEQMEHFARNLFKIYSADELLSGISSVNYEKIRRGVVAKGMTKADVMTAYGPPCKARTPSLDNDTWIYQVDSVKSRRVVFRAGTVLDIIELD